jgi:hypothetical protein
VVNLRERDHLHDLGLEGRVILKSSLKENDGGAAWTGFVWFKMRANGRFLLGQQ